MIDLKYLSLQGKCVDAICVEFGGILLDGTVVQSVNKEVSEMSRRYNTSNGKYAFYVILARIDE